MPLSLDRALSSLSSAAADRRVAARLDHARELLADELAWVEAELRRAVGQGAAPGTDAARHLVGRGGKRVRPLALLASAGCFGHIPEAARELAVVVELVHSATLLHDDVVDEGMERRGAETSRRIWGNGVSVLAGDLLLVNALERALRVDAAVLADLVVTLRRLVDGEIVQLRGRTSLDLTRASYFRILRDKTASLFGWATRSGARLAGAAADDVERMGSFGEQLGIAFQLVDDVLDYSGQQTGKTLLADLAEGKLTLPLVLAVERDPKLVEPLQRIFGGDQAPVAEVARAVVESGVCDEVRQQAETHTQAAVAALDALPPTPARELLRGVAFELVGRMS